MTMIQSLTTRFSFTTAIHYCSNRPRFACENTTKALLIEITIVLTGQSNDRIYYNGTQPLSKPIPVSCLVCVCLIYFLQYLGNSTITTPTFIRKHTMPSRMTSLPQDALWPPVAHTIMCARHSKTIFVVFRSTHDNNYENNYRRFFLQ